MTNRPDATGLDLAAVRSPLGRRLGPRATGGAWRSWPGQTRSRSFLRPRVPGAGRRNGRTRSAAAVLAADGGLAGPGRRQPAAPIQPAENDRAVRRAARDRSSPGRPLFFATALTLGGFAIGVLVESHMGRPTKIEGNPDHPASLGATDAITQAAILDLYDPDRSQVVTHNGRVSTWDDFLAVLVAGAQRQRAKEGGRAAGPDRDGHLADPGRSAPGSCASSSPRRSGTPTSRPTRDAARAGAELAFGEELEPIHHLDKADVIVALDADFFAEGPGGSATPAGVRRPPRGRRRASPARTGSTSSATPGRPRTRTRPARR